MKKQTNGTAVTRRLHPVAERLLSLQRPGELQKDFAHRLKTTTQTLANWRGGGGPSLENVTDACRAVGLSPTWLLLGRGPKYLKQEGAADLIMQINAAMVELANDPRASGLVVELFEDGLEILREAQRELDGEA